MALTLSLNTNPLVNRFAEPDDLIETVARDLRLRDLQLTHEFINPSWQASTIRRLTRDMDRALQRTGVRVTSGMTGPYGRLNHFGHPDRDVRRYYVDWFKTFADIIGDLGGKSVGTQFAIFTYKDFDDPARREELIKIAIDCWAEVAEHAAGAGLDYVFWEPMSIGREFGEEGLPLMALGHAGANFMRREIEHGDHEVIGIGHGRTLSAAVGYMPRVMANDLRFVSLLGGLTRNFAANPHDVMHRIAEKTGMPAYVMPVPFFANTAEDREVLLAQRGVTTVFDMGCRAELKIVGIGTVDAQAQLVTSGMIELGEVEEIANLGGVGEMLGHFFNANGQWLETALTGRTIAASVENADMSRIVALAGGLSKVDAIRAVLKSGRLYGLITDERTAKALIGQPNGK